MEGALKDLDPRHRRMIERHFQQATVGAALGQEGSVSSIDSFGKFMRSKDAAHQKRVDAERHRMNALTWRLNDARERRERHAIESLEREKAAEAVELSPSFTRLRRSHSHSPADMEMTSFGQGLTRRRRRTGRRRTGKRRTGKRRTGKRRTGKRRTGKRRTGKRRTGKRRTGKRRTAKRHR